MNRLTKWLGLGNQQEPSGLKDEMAEAMEIARQATRQEDYDRALSALDRAMRLADEMKDTQSVAIIALHQIDVMIYQNQIDEAERLTQTVLQTTEATNLYALLAYAVVSQGKIAQARGEWSEAQDHYERARDLGIQRKAAGVEGRAMGHLADVYMHEGNASYAVHLLQESLPKLNQAGDIELTSYFVGRLGEAMIANGQESEGKNLLERALQLADQMQDHRLTRRWALALGRYAQDQEHYQQAYLHYKKALTLFQANPVDDYIDTLESISRCSLLLGEYNEALVYAEQADQVSTGGENEGQIRKARGAMGMALRALGRTKEALPHLQAAIDPNNPDIDTIRHLAAVQIDLGDTNTAEQIYQQALDHIGTDPAQELHRAQVYRDMGLLEVQRGQLRAAIDRWGEALPIFDGLRQYNQVARLHCDIASARRQIGQGSRAIRDYEQALITLNKVDDLGTRGLVLSNAANAYADQGDLQSAESFFKESIDIAVKIEDPIAESTRRGNYGWFLLNTGQSRQAVDMLTRALEISKAQNLSLQTAVQTDNLGLAYDAMSQYKTALQYHQDALAQLEAMTRTPPARWSAMLKANTANTHVSLGQIDQAMPLLEDAKNIAQAAEDSEVLAGVLVGYSRGLLHQDKPEEAGPAITEAISLARRAEMRRLLAEALALQSEHRAKIGDEDAARETWAEAENLFKMLNDPRGNQTPLWLK